MLGSSSTQADDLWRAFCKLSLCCVAYVPFYLFAVIFPGMKFMLVCSG